MSETVIFSIGAVIFAMTVWGVVMAGGMWFGQLKEAEEAREAEKGRTRFEPPQADSDS
jgi:hypothetical protein